MKAVIPLFAAALLCTAASPAGAQDLLKPFQTFIQDLTGPPPKPPVAAPKPTSPEADKAPEPEQKPAELAVDTDAVVPLPRPRPAVTEEAPPAVTEAETPPVAPEAPVIPLEEASAPEPDAPPPTEQPAEPDRVFQTACPAVIVGMVEATPLPPIAEGSCAERSPLSLTGVLVNGRMVTVSGGVVTNCAMATALPGWVAAVDGYLGSTAQTQIAAVNVGTSYLCRNVVGGTETERLSEHGFADALDIVGFTLADGRTVTVDPAWTGPAPDSTIVKFAHDAACSVFMTTLGPEANAEHHDHLHIDMGCHGKSCSARICE